MSYVAPAQVDDWQLRVLSVLAGEEWGHFLWAATPGLCVLVKSGKINPDGNKPHSERAKGETL